MKKYWILFAGVILVSFTVLGLVGYGIYQEKPPLPVRVVTEDGTLVFEGETIQTGQNVWQAMGGMETGSVWGHGSYVAPDWTADWLHRESMYILDKWGEDDYGLSYNKLPKDKQAQLKARLAEMMRKNTYNIKSGEIIVPAVRAEAIISISKYYEKLFTEGNEDYAIRRNSLTDKTKLKQLAAFFWWSSWAASTSRPGEEITYTSNWPHEELVENKPTGDTIVWTGVSIIVLLAGIGGMAWWYASRREKHQEFSPPDNDPLLSSISTPSQKAVLKYFWTVSGLFLFQIIMGVVTAHYGVEGNGFYGFPLADYLPYTITRTWHTQLGIFWIATAWLAAGLYIAPAVSGYEPKGQVLGVNVLFGALLVVVLGSMTGEYLSVMNLLPDHLWFYFGHSGYEYIDLGRFFQIALLIGLILWLYLMVRALKPALAKKDEQKTILTLFIISSIAIALFYGASLMYGKHTNLAVAEFWRWWVVHLWVEGFFEVFATVVIAFLFARLKLVQLKTAGQASVLASTIFLSGGIIGTLHHLYFSGTSTYVLALGSVFSALEVVPLLFVGYEAVENYRISRQKEWIERYKWPIYFFIAVAFWNLVGAGLFGFMINPPIALYYMQGLNTTPVHGHSALFGVYGMLGLGLTLFALRGMTNNVWDTRLLKHSFWWINIGLFTMVVISLLPVGLMQTWASVKYGYWYARSAEFMQTDIMEVLRWLRAPGDTIFAIGAVMFVLFVIKNTIGTKK